MISTISMRAEDKCKQTEVAWQGKRSRHLSESEQVSHEWPDQSGGRKGEGDIADHPTSAYLKRTETSTSTDKGEMQFMEPVAAFSLVEVLFSIEAVVEKLVDDYARVSYNANGIRREMSLHKQDLESEGLFRKGAHFNVEVVRERGFTCTRIISRPDLEDNQYRKRAQQVDLSFLDE